MTAGIQIGLDAKGGAQAEAEAKKVARGVDAITASEHKAAAAAKGRGKAQHDANAHGYRTAHAQGDHGGFMHSLHVAGMAGGELGHLGHRFGRAGRFGVAGLATAGLGLAATSIMESLEAYGERMAEIVRKSAEIAHKMREARESLGDQGLSYADSNAGSLRRIGNAGLSFDEVKAWQKKGLGASGLAALVGTSNFGVGAEAALFAGKLGSDPNAAAEAIAKMGGARSGIGPQALGSYVAELLQGRRIHGHELVRAIDGEGDINERMGQIQGFNNRASAAGAESMEKGEAASAAARRLNKALSPDAAAMTEAWKKATEESEVLNRIADDQNALLKIWQNLSNNKGSAEVQAIRATKDSAAVLGSTNIGGTD